ncbi:MAG: pyruvate dehydrogenase (acetyl-transferring) E1 component subunit alpha [Spirochaetales bacterium]|nr:pyruvate dehydrogenase (acetyl-transferring) E1 component subunit alpha [Spirochaetales bacterium]
MKDALKETGKAKTLELLSTMLLIRRFEEKAGQMYGLKKIGGFCHLYIGQEAVAAGVIKALDLQRDYVIGGYRDHGYALASGMDPKGLMAELYGKKTGCSGGKGGSMHMYSPEHHMLGGNGIVGSQIPVATGVGLSLKAGKTGGAAVCFFGDGAIHQGAFHESLNMAQVMKLPVIYICENNQYGMGTDFRRVSAVEDFTLMGQAYGMQAQQLNGMDVLEVYTAIKRALENLRKDGLPGFLEIRTYRYKGHSMSDPAKYRTREELESYKAQDPILILKKALIETGMITEKEFEEMDGKAKAQAEDAVLFAEESPEPDREALYEHVYV